MNKLYLFSERESAVVDHARILITYLALKMDDIRVLERTTDQLIDLLNKIKAENKALRNKLDELSTEKSLLMQKNDQAKTRLESMISRLKTLEQTA